MKHTIIETVTLRDIPMGQRKYVGMLAQRHLESKTSPGTIESLRLLLREFIDDNYGSDTRAAEWLLARLVADPQIELTCRRHICDLMYATPL